MGFERERADLRAAGQWQGDRGYATINLSVFGGPDVDIDVHTIGNSSSKDVVGGPGSLKAEHACDGKGIDFIEACFPPPAP